jgi:hypothetical protein
LVLRSSGAVTAKRADPATPATRADVAGRVTAYRCLLPVTTLSSQHAMPSSEMDFVPVDETLRSAGSSLS